jgi:hypothetical protein
MRYAAALVLVAFACAAHAQSVTITLSPAMQEVVQGERPRFEVEVRSKGRARVADFARRPDMAERLVKPRLAGKGDMDDMPWEFLLELAPMTEADYVILAPGSTLRFTNRGEPFKLNVLAPGEYTVYLRLRTDFPEPIIESSRVKFRVVPAKGGTR